jgi:Fungalysin/Thermolysin Propeptide Motif
LNLVSLKQGLAATAAALVVSISPAFAQIADLGVADAAVSSEAKSLAAAKRGSMKASVAAFLSAKGVDSATSASLIETSQFADKQGRRFARYEQVVNGLRVHGGYVKAAFDASGAPIHMIDRLAPAGGRAAKATLGEAEALRLAIDRNFSGFAIPAGSAKSGAVTSFAKTADFYRAPTVERVLIARGKALEEGFLVETWSQPDGDCALPAPGPDTVVCDDTPGWSAKIL